jgi:DNA-binding transcriptional LysR family regulator
VTAEEGSYSAAAKALGTTQPTIGRQIAALEDELNSTLVERIGRGIELTPAGLALVEHAREMGDAARKLALVASSHSVALEGVVTITAGDSSAVHLLPPIIAEVHRRYPGILLNVFATNETADLREREADIAIRNYRTEDEELIATRLPDGRGWLYGSCEYLSSVGNPAADADLSVLTFIGFDNRTNFVASLSGFGITIAPEQILVASENHNLQWELVRRGFGVGVMLERIGDADPTVARALPGMLPLPVPMWLTTHRAVRTSRRVRAVFDIIAAAFRGEEVNGQLLR